MLENRNMRRQISTGLFSLLIFLFTSEEVQGRYIVGGCYTSSCGDIKSIKYPFRLKTDPVGCGDPEYELSCENNKTILEFLSGKYYVNQISYDEHIIRVVDVNLANGSCSLPYKSLSLGDLMGDSRYTMVFSTFTSFVNCSSEISNQAYRRVPCLSGNESGVYVIYDNYIISDLRGPCSFISRVPTISQAVLFPSYQSILKLMQSGFDLQWPAGCWYTSYGYECYEPG